MTESTREFFPCPRCLSEDHVREDERLARVKYKGRMVAFREPFLTCDNCGHAFSDATTYELAGTRLREAASPTQEMTAETVAAVRKDLGVSRKLLEIALETADKQTAAWEKSRKKMSEPVQNVWRTIAGDPTVPAKLLLARRNVWIAFIDRLSTSSSPSQKDLSGAASVAVAATAVAIFASPVAAGVMRTALGTLAGKRSSEEASPDASRNQVLSQYLETCRNARHPESHDSEALAALCAEWLSAVQSVTKMTHARECLEEFGSAHACILVDWKERYESAQAELARVSDLVAARHDAVRNTLVHVSEHPRAHLRLAARLVDTLHVEDVLDLYHRSSGRQPEIRFAVLFAEKLQERVALPN